MIDIDALEKLAKGAAESGVTGHRVKFFMTMDPEIVLALIAEVRALRTYREMAPKQVYELMGVVIDIEQGHGFDSVCLNTIKRVLDQLRGIAGTKSCG
ncbi:hypothetical protein WM24_23755 [Burkholderia ubonensis]|uniref:hypothetical protein n=1 Tax=Burkholderia ubonensis TaxID=101571 RepID=UPI000753E135|nr:hypothetical protein [Burkholderia ubonensis]KWN80855.1 hypothetical protein WM24_23755 [Burkholderia ubonensis]